MSAPSPVNGHAPDDLEATLAISIIQAQAKKAPGFKRAVKRNAKARVAIDGVSGSGKTYTALTLATLLAGPEGRIAAIDTEHGSMAKYADVFDFDCDTPDSYTTDYLLQQLSWAEREGYAVFLVDSLSHFWMGRDGALEFVDAVKKRSRDQMEGWKAFRPHERQMVDRFIASPCHVIVTMRVKTDYEEITDSSGKKKRVKVGLAPVQREGMEYEFDLVCTMDDDNGLVVSKTRCSWYADERNRVASRPGPEYFLPLARWLNPTEATGSRPAAAVSQPAQQATGTTENPTIPAPSAQEAKRPWGTFKEMLACFGSLKEQLPPDAYYEVLNTHGVQHANQFRAAGIALRCYEALLAKAAEHKAKSATTFENFDADEGGWQ